MSNDYNLVPSVREGLKFIDSLKDISGRPYEGVSDPRPEGYGSKFIFGGNAVQSRMSEGDDLDDEVFNRIGTNIHLDTVSVGRVSFEVCCADFSSSGLGELGEPHPDILRDAK